MGVGLHDSQVTHHPFVCVLHDSYGRERDWLQRLSSLLHGECQWLREARHMAERQDGVHVPDHEVAGTSGTTDQATGGPDEDYRSPHTALEGLEGHCPTDIPFTYRAVHADGA